MPPRAFECSHDMIEIEHISGNTCSISYSSDDSEIQLSPSVFKKHNSFVEEQNPSVEEHIPNSGDDDSFEDTLYHTLSTICSSESYIKSLPKPAIKQSKKNMPTVGATRSVSFNSVQIREHDITLGDHPSSSTGPPVQLDWKPKNESTIDLDQYENSRQPRRKRRQLKLSFQEREEILSSSGFTVDQLKNAWMESLKIRQQRYETIMKGSIATKVEEMWESACRKFNRFWALSSAEEGIEVKVGEPKGKDSWSYVSSDDGNSLTSWFVLECLPLATSGENKKSGTSWNGFSFSRQSCR
mmetsp:Transcript_28914/g.43665  ORF Transcript_28914/g.43665 Transcript_28914/m.43665 type:complete len:298 (+) Transcript_28914:94-987(+)|eukprot:CAMPEP_0178917234 /NCGR_PEP_ID=MMETSP0786-20121207/13130_1 /TAXON_ID=186022 /ORGANISM="Thalassionema frauenfeldii, Strain CCMP 1798" /LENGTH=297 /DNA_ID=CAMNT_0020590755 /DNA_START=40 /DNA_END=933 /DNA_ORIENTATION=+